MASKSGGHKSANRKTHTEVVEYGVAMKPTGKLLDRVSEIFEPPTC